MNAISERPPMNKDYGALRVSTWVLPQQVLLDADLKNRAHALELVATSVARVHPVDPMTVFRSLWRRELAASTALGNGVAIPHASIPGISHPLTVLVRPKIPLAFDAPDDQPVSQLLVILVPQVGARYDHLQLLALIARLFSEQGFRKKLDEVSSAEEALEAFRKGVSQALDQP